MQFIKAKISRELVESSVDSVWGNQKGRSMNKQRGKLPLMACRHTYGQRDLCICISEWRAKLCMQTGRNSRARSSRMYTEELRVQETSFS